MTLTVVQQVEPQIRRWTKGEYYRMAEMGWFLDQTVELVEGEVLSMSPPAFPHVSRVERTARLLEKAFGAGFWVMRQSPLNLGETTEPQPDVAVVEGDFEAYKSHPKSALLLVEVSDSSLAYDRGRKGSLYAKHQIPDYWIVNLIDRQLEVCREPIADASQHYGFRYATVTILKPGDSATPLARPDLRISIASLFE